MFDIDKILQLGSLGFNAQQISQIMELNMKEEAPMNNAPEEVIEPRIPAEHDAPENIVGKLPDAKPEVVQPQIDYAKLAEEIALRQQKSVTFNPEEPKPVEAEPVKSAEDITLGLL